MAPHKTSGTALNNRTTGKKLRQRNSQFPERPHSSINAMAQNYAGMQQVSVKFWLVPLLDGITQGNAGQDLDSQAI